MTLPTASAPADLPAGTIEILAGTPRGGGQDRAARALSRAVAAVVDHPVRVTNLPGRGGGNAWDELVGHHGDPLWLAISSATLLTNRLTGVAGLGHDDVTQIAVLCTEYIAFAVPAESAASTPDDVKDMLRRATPPTVALATARGNANHIAVALVANSAGVDPQTIEVRVFDSARHAVADTIEGNADLVAVSAASLLSELADGSMRMIVSTSPYRLAPPFHDVPTWAERGVDCSIGTWRGVVGAPGIAAVEADRWSEVMNAAVATAEWTTALEQHLWTDTYLPADDTRRFMVAEEKRMHSALAALSLLPS